MFTSSLIRRKLRLITFEEPTASKPASCRWKLPQRPASATALLHSISQVFLTKSAKAFTYQ